MAQHPRVGYFNVGVFIALVTHCRENHAARIGAGREEPCHREEGVPRANVLTGFRERGTHAPLCFGCGQRLLGSSGNTKRVAATSEFMIRPEQRER